MSVWISYVLEEVHVNDIMAADFIEKISLGQV